MNATGRKRWSSVLLMATSLALLAVIAQAQARDRAPVQADDFYMFADVCNSPWSMDTNGARRTKFYGTGGIKVTNQLIPDRIDRYSVCIDGSGITGGSAGGGGSAGSLNAADEQADFAASAASAYFVSRSAHCTLPTANGIAGKEIVVCNAGNGTTIAYSTTNGEAVSGLRVVPINNRPYQVDRFISDGRSWYKE